MFKTETFQNTPGNTKRAMTDKQNHETAELNKFFSETHFETLTILFEILFERLTKPTQKS